MNVCALPQPIVLCDDFYVCITCWSAEDWTGTPDGPLCTGCWTQHDWPTNGS